jgi:hypothetical protein
MVRPTLPCFSVAPTTATLRGAKMASSGCHSLYRRMLLPGLLGVVDFVSVSVTGM